MHKIAFFVFTCLVCAGRGRRLRHSPEHVWGTSFEHPRANLEGSQHHVRDSVSNSSTLLQRILRAENPSAGWHLHLQRVLGDTKLPELRASQDLSAHRRVRHPLMLPGEGPVITAACGRSVQLLALALDGQLETYHVRMSSEDGALDSKLLRMMVHDASTSSWNVHDHDEAIAATLTLGTPDELFLQALGAAGTTRDSEEDATLRQDAATPHWPASLRLQLARRHLSGCGTIAFDANWFLEAITTTPVHRPILFPGGSAKLGLRGLQVVEKVVHRVASSLSTARSNASSNPFADLLLQAVAAVAEPRGSVHGSGDSWAGEGRLFGEYITGEMLQVGEDITSGCHETKGGQLRVAFAPDAPLGLTLSPVHPSWDEENGLGTEVDEVVKGSAAERAGVQVGMALSRLEQPELVLAREGVPVVSHQSILAEIAARRAKGDEIVVVFDTAEPLSRLYAVEMPARAAIGAFALAEGMGSAAGPQAALDLQVGEAIRARCPGGDSRGASDHAGLRARIPWVEETPRLFLGDAGSTFSAHMDICPMLEFVHGLCGMKLLGVASPLATPRLAAEHSGDYTLDDEAGDSLADGVEETRIPVDRPLDPYQEALLLDKDVSVLSIRQGDLAVFYSGALHFASNGLDDPSTGGLNGALYHGAVTQEVLPFLRNAAAEAEAAVAAHGSDDEGGDREDESFTPRQGMQAMRASELVREIDMLERSPR